MATPRLPFLWPLLFRPVSYPHAHSRHFPQTLRQSRDIVTSPHHQQGGTQRYGTAQEPAAHLREQVDSTNVKDEAKDTPQKKNKAATEEEEDDERPHPATASTHLDTPDAIEAISSAPESISSQSAEEKPLETVLHMPSPAEEESQKPPHLKTPPYIHHFDTYGLVKDLTKSGFTQEQAVTIMKAVRGVLTDNMELARDGLVSKSNVENESYLFRAACSELKTELGNKRKGENEKMRSERNQLQHEVDILNQRLGQETSHLKDELKGLFDDRKMAVRQEQRGMETSLQELNYKITVALNSDARSEVEGLRWVLTRRAAITVASAAVMLFLSLKLSSQASHSEQKKKSKEQKPPPEDYNVNNSTDPRLLNNTEVLGGEILASEGGVSLG
ncbi:hypothetical protein B0J11DRAFT_434615 [Dendryphion nanum]|uniref:Uncharacterized protein n=1 Tax=Dendryphion nanum TaxID=256645 RepID=A0A9P9DUQ5_9PLEO|nr:hypothetical protein B0J11DRAFT_434615 [Dendryphion nanum]